MQSQAIKVLYCCSNSEKDEKLRDELEKHLGILQSEGVIETWHRGMISAGQVFESEFYTQLETANIVLPLISPDFIASDENWDTVVKLAMEKHRKKLTRVVPILLRPVDSNWRLTFANTKALPEDGRPITEWKPYDKAFVNITEGIREVVTELTDSPLKKVSNTFANLASATISSVISPLSNLSRPRRRRRKSLLIPILLLIALGGLASYSIFFNLSSSETKPRSTVKSTPKDISTGWIQLGVINKDSKLSAGTQLLKPSNNKLYPSIDPPFVPPQGKIVTVKYKVNLRKDKFLSSEQFEELQPGEKVTVHKVEVVQKATQTSPYIRLGAQVSKCDRTCSNK
jgi:hypothetical protein